MLKIYPGCVNTELSLFEITEWDTRQTVTKADEKSVIEGEGLVYTVCTKKHDDGRLLLAVAHGPSREPVVIEGVWPVPPSLWSAGDPYQILQALCEDYGVPITIDGTPQQLVVDARIRGRGPESIVQLTTQALKNYSAGKSFRPSCSFQLLDRDVVHVQFLFMLDLDAIKRDLSTLN